LIAKMQGDSSRFDSNTVAFLNAKEKIFSNYFNEFEDILRYHATFLFQTHFEYVF